ncbi:MAG: FAD-dependent oxidoreductase [Firmicutes bacterium]|nr:FAD-dependent oxidoreductase [Bacillota bacterium]
MILSQIYDNCISKSCIGNILFSESYDVVVAGLGTAGSIAAITAAKNNLKTLGVERFNCMGGTITAGGVSGYYFGGRGGLYEEIDRISDSYQGSVYTNIRNKNIDAKKYALEQEALREGVDIRLESVIIGVYLKANKVQGIKLLSNGKVCNISCRIIIDCTGDAEICKMAGAALRRGRDGDAKVMPFTSVKNFVDADTIERTNFDMGRVEQSDVEALSSAIVKSGAHYNEAYYTDGKHNLLGIMPLLGLREGNRIVGKATLGLKDYLQGKQTDRPVFYGYADVDKHGIDNAFESETMIDWFVACNLGALNISVPVPFEVMIPKGLDGILAAGRCMSFDHDMLSCVRMARDMQKSGEVAATAAYLAITRNIALEDVSYEQLASILRKTGCLNDENNRGIRFDSPRKGFEIEDVYWLKGADEVKAGLDSDCPGVALWSCKLLGEDIKPHLISWMSSKSVKLRKHSAMALALTDSVEGLPILRDMIVERDLTMLQDCRKNNQMRGYIAIYLVGKLCDKDIADELIDIITNPNEQNRDIYKTEKGFKNILYQYLSFATTSLVRIANSNKSLRPKIVAALKNAFDDEMYIERLYTGSRWGCDYLVSADLKTYALNEVKKLQRGK